ncbi:MAG: arsenite efflux transporter metallochaperone ArsD [Anaerolineaceae bacterium]|nr:arsenite efflux transporter metallochaperone ArsD [Anaerolineaceae bacterium]
MTNSNGYSPNETTISISTNRVDVELFDPPMCCSTGLCGPTLDQTLLNVNEMVINLRKEGLIIERYQMTSNPNAFLNNADVMRLVQEQQLTALPITVVKGKVIKTGAYPDLNEIKAAIAQIGSAS